jgi:hypothetical protein
MVYITIGYHTDPNVLVAHWCVRQLLQPRDTVVGGVVKKRPAVPKDVIKDHIMVFLPHIPLAYFKDKTGIDFGTDIRAYTWFFSIVEFPMALVDVPKRI